MKAATVGDMIPEAVISKILEHGVLGILVVIFIYAIVRLSSDLTAERDGRRLDAEKKSTELRELQEKRIADQVAYTSKLLEINSAVHATVDKLADVANHISKLRRTHDA